MNLQTIKININDLINLDINADSFIYLYLKCNEYTDIPANILANTDFNKLEQKGYIKNTLEGIVIRESAKKLFIATDLDNKFLDFFLTFPMKVPSDNPQGRPLRTQTSDSQSADIVKRKYLKLIKKPGLHEHIMNVLRAEIQMRINSNALRYMNNIEAWLNQRNWEKYDYLLNDNIESNEKVTSI